MAFARPRLAAMLLLLGTVSSRSIPAQNATVLTTVGTDTFAFERYARQGNVVTGSWVVLHPPGVYVHDYRITLGPDGLPVHYSMRYSVPVSLEDPPSGVDSVFLDYGRDTVAYTFVSSESTFTRKVPAHEAFPFLGQSIVGLDLALRRLRAAHADSGIIVANETSNLIMPPRTLRIRLLGDSAYLGSKTLIHLTPDGGFRDMNDGRLAILPAPSIDIEQLTEHFVDEYTPRVAVLRKAAAARVEISLPAAQLDRFVGSYGRGVAMVTREGEHLVVDLPHQSLKATLLAMSQSSFFVRKPDLVFAFDVDEGGEVKGVTMARGESKQRLARDN